MLVSLKMLDKDYLNEQSKSFGTDPPFLHPDLKWDRVYVVKVLHHRQWSWRVSTDGGAIGGAVFCKQDFTNLADHSHSKEKGVLES